VPKGRIFPITRDELVESAALLRCIRHGILDRTPSPPRPLDILAQQMVASCVPEPWHEGEMLETFRRAWPYRDLEGDEMRQVLELHAEGRRALLHRDQVNGRVRATKRARLRALLSGGAIPDTADYQVRLEPEGTLIGSVHEDWAVEANGGDVFQLGNASWRILRVEPGVVRVADAQGQPPTLPFWLGEAPGRTRELAEEIGALREMAGDRAALDGVPAATALLREDCGQALPEAAALQVAEYVDEGRRSLGSVPTQRRVVMERFFDESGGMQLVVHAPFGSRINRAWGLALRKKFCVGFGFELQAAANEEAIILSLGPQHSFELAGVFEYLQPETARDVLIQALLASPLFETRWRWNVQRALLMDRSRGGKRVPAPLLRMRAGDLLAQAFPQVVACGETLPPGPIDVPMEHPIVRQTIEDCLTEAMDVDGFLAVLHGLRDGSIQRVAVDTVEPSAFARGILSAQPYSFLDDAPLEERRTQAVVQRRTLDPRQADEVGALDPQAIARVCEEAWPQPANAEEVHEALLWMGWVADSEAAAWLPWLEELRAAGRVALEAGAWAAVDATADPLARLRGRLEALGPVLPGDPRLRGPGVADDQVETLLLQLEGEGVAMRARIAGQQAWCDRRLLARIHRYTLDRLRREIEPVPAGDFLRFLACWQYADPEYRLEGPRGVTQVVSRLAGFELSAAAWEASVLPTRLRGYRREWLDQVTLSGEVAWARLWGAGLSPARRTPIALVPRQDLDAWLALSPGASGETAGAAAEVYSTLLMRGAMFFQELSRAARLPPAFLDLALSELIAQGRVTCDSFGGLRWLMVPPSRRSGGALTAGRWSVLRRDGAAPAQPAEFVARQLLQRTGVVFRRTVARERLPVLWRDIARACRLLEARGEIRGGRFVAGFDGEQYALPEAIPLLRTVRKRGPRPLGAPPVKVSAADPLNYQGILTPDEKVSPSTRQDVTIP
jgi:ATP-dependent Lhr-like helicase